MESLKDKYFIFSFCIILFLVSVVPQIFQPLFVHRSGKFIGIGLVFAIILIAAILLRWKHTKFLFNLTFFIVIALEISILLNIWQQYYLPHFILLIVMLGLTVVFNFSTKIKNYLLRFEK